MRILHVTSMATHSMLLVLLSLCVSSCSSVPKNSLDRFAEIQAPKMISKSAYEDADFIFSATSYLPTIEDIAGLKQAWYEYANSFPDSKAINDVEKELQNPKFQVVIISLFMTEYENADLRNKSMGWTVGPPGVSVVELAERDVPLRTLMPVVNDWARYYMIKYSHENVPDTITVSNRFKKVELKIK